MACRRVGKALKALLDTAHLERARSEVLPALRLEDLEARLEA
jgi:hypothetical protein